MINNLSNHSTNHSSGSLQTVVIINLQQPKYQTPVSPQTVVVCNLKSQYRLLFWLARTEVIANFQTQYEPMIWFILNIGDRPSPTTIWIFNYSGSPKTEALD